jgi:hypothetical protein
VSRSEILGPHLQNDDTGDGWTLVAIDDVAELFDTRRLVKIRGASDGEPFTDVLTATGDGTHAQGEGASDGVTQGSRRMNQMRGPPSGASASW